jgi:chromate transporter
LYFAGVNFVWVLLGSGLFVMLVRNRRRVIAFPAVLMPGLAGSAATSFSLGGLFWTFFKIGALLYGSGYVLFAFLQAELVTRHGWLTDRQLIDAIAFGQITPGPLSTSTTFIGYLLAGVPGALIATFAFYLPAFLVVAVSNPLIPRIRGSSWASGLLDGVNVAALGIMAAVTWDLARAAYPDGFAILIGFIAAVLVLRYNISSVGLVVFGAGMGLLSAII